MILLSVARPVEASAVPSCHFLLLLARIVDEADP
jgi:hypothetical protein